MHLTLPSVHIGEPLRFEFLTVFPLFIGEEHGVDYLLSDGQLRGAGSLGLQDAEVFIRRQARSLEAPRRVDIQRFKIPGRRGRSSVEPTTGLATSGRI